ncbi:hypothetical protein MNBD_NITROSPINAE01-1314 [hydrothermal vent metagenome]|uniref:HTH cro/C1-type domain-containing protein n=1 Tax=hydrothermal vent metagenome TaxID=652676 RepID=A0A3B1CA69_9ZZZZ
MNGKDLRHTFKDRLRLLMKGDKPYTWARKVGIEKGLFQYYWQKEKIPTYGNLLKIQDFTGCSLDWLLTGKAVDLDQLDNLPLVKETNPIYGQMNLRRAESLEKVKKLYASKNIEDIELLEGVLAKLSPASKAEVPSKALA